MVGFILLIAAFILALLQSLRGWVPNMPGPHLGWLAIALALLAMILGNSVHP
jgi:hypothetical protein